LWSLVAPLLSDANRGVRIRTVALLAAVPTAGQPAADRERFERAAAEFVAAQRLNADRPEARTTLGNFQARRGLFVDAEAEYKAALRLSPQSAAAAGRSRYAARPCCLQPRCRRYRGRARICGAVEQDCAGRSEPRPPDAGPAREGDEARWAVTDRCRNFGGRQTIRRRRLCR